MTCLLILIRCFLRWERLWICDNVQPLPRLTGPSWFDWQLLGHHYMVRQAWYLSKQRVGISRSPAVTPFHSMPQHPQGDGSIITYRENNREVINGSRSRIESSISVRVDR
jgi:hypothetical protein